MRVLLLGANGQLGSDIARLWNDPAVTLVHATRQDADVTDEALIRDLVERARPEVTINTTAFHNLPQCEQDPELAFRVNVVGGWNVAAAAAAVGSTLVQISTDYVFDGEKRAPYLEDDARRAVNIYGAAKIATEDVVRITNPRTLIARVSGLYGLAGSAGKGGNFVETMLRLAREGNPIRVVSDQVTAPTNTAEIAEALLPLVKEGAAGTVHLAAAEGCSWHAFAAAIFEICGLKPGLEAVTTAEFGAPLARPMFSVLGTTRAPALRHWRAGLERYLREKGHAPS
ncbi:MAG: dTDP-4-dehydrorhamnose reductase [Dehalococcoidia bacterium]|nr:dTDP-4-dehydrorhamnose reductase [Dehalococcoidia bacterium]